MELKESRSNTWIAFAKITVGFVFHCIMTCLWWDHFETLGHTVCVVAIVMLAFMWLLLLWGAITIKP